MRLPCHAWRNPFCFQSPMPSSHPRSLPTSSDHRTSGIALHWNPPRACPSSLHHWETGPRHPHWVLKRPLPVRRRSCSFFGWREASPVMMGFVLVSNGGHKPQREMELAEGLLFYWNGREAEVLHVLFPSKPFPLLTIWFEYLWRRGTISYNLRMERSGPQKVFSVVNMILFMWVETSHPPPDWAEQGIWREKERFWGVWSLSQSLSSLSGWVWFWRDPREVAVGQWIHHSNPPKRERLVFLSFLNYLMMSKTCGNWKEVRQQQHCKQENYCLWVPIESKGHEAAL